MMDGGGLEDYLNYVMRLVDNAENGQRWPSRTNSSRQRQLKREALDRDFLIQAHEASRVEYMRTSMISCDYRISTTASFRQEAPTASAPLSSLRAITLQQLTVGKRHNGRVLHGRLCVKPFIVSGIFSVLEDEAEDGVRLTIYNVLPATASLREVENRLPLGMRVIVKEPFFKVSADGKTAIRVDNPADIALDETWKKGSSPRSSSDDALLAELEAIRSEGNELFGAQSWIGAVNKYSECIHKAIVEMGRQTNKTMLEKFNTVVMLVYSNRAEARLRMGAYEDALSDADKSLEFDQKNVKSLVRKGKAAYRMGLFEKSCANFTAALDQSPDEVSIVASLKDSTIALEQSRTGEYDLSSVFFRECNVDVPACADYVGPVEIGRVYRGYGRRGLFATKKVKPGQLLLVSNPLAILRRKPDLLKKTVSMHFHKRGGYNGEMNTGSHQDFLTELADQTMKSKRKMAQLYSLSSYGKLEMEIPSMELFTPGSEWVPPSTETMEVNMALIRDIANLNAFCDNSDYIHKLKGDATVEKVSSGIWALPSFVNHSCAPNCVLSFIGDAVFVRAAVQIAEGEELSVPYFSALFDFLETRQARCKHWLFTCECERCQVEEALNQQLAKIKVAEARSHEEGQKIEEVQKQLVKVANEVEALIRSCDTRLGERQQGWIRASFIAAYFLKYALAMDEPESQSRITTLKVIVDSMASVSVTDAVLRLAAILLREVEQKYFKHSQSYRLTLDRVLAIYRVMFGMQPNSTLLKLIRARWAPLSPEDFRKVLQGFSLGVIATQSL